MSNNSFTEIEIQTPFRRIAAKKWGDNTGLPVIGLHGWLDNANTFDGIAPLMPGLQLVAMDLPGHGRSDHRPPGVYYHYTDYVDDVIAVADKLGWDRFVLLGHSMGTGVSVFVAGAFPERVRGLMLIEGLGAKTDSVADAPANMREAVLKLQRVTRLDESRPRAFQILVRARSQVGRIRRQSAEILVRRGAMQTREGTALLSDSRLNLPPPHQISEEYVAAFLKRIAVPTLLVMADDGLLRQRPYLQGRRNLVQKLQTVWLPGNHHLHLDTPEPVARVLSQFLREHNLIAH